MKREQERIKVLSANIKAKSRIARIGNFLIVARYPISTMTKTSGIKWLHAPHGVFEKGVIIKRRQSTR